MTTETVTDTSELMSAEQQQQQQDAVDNAVEDGVGNDAVDVDVDVDDNDNAVDNDVDVDASLVAPSFEKYKKYVPYCTNDKNTTIGMPEVKKIEKKTKEQLEEKESPNNNNNIAPPVSAEGLTVAVGDSYDDAYSDVGSFSIRANSPPNSYFSKSRDAFGTSQRIDSCGSVISAATLMQFRDSLDKSIPLNVANGGITCTERLDREITACAEMGIINVPLSSSAFADQERLCLSEDVYAFILACPVFSAPFWFAAYFILVKCICYFVLMIGIKNDHEFEGTHMVQVVKLFLIPVAVAMQEDLMTVYANAANKKYDGSVMKADNYATWAKWVLSNFLRLIDGLLSLGVNFGVMLMTNTILGIFLNFAALHFLQFIDDVLYELAEKGFFGDTMEEATILSKTIKFRRRAHLHGDKCNNFIYNLDSILLAFTAFLCFTIYGVVQGVFYYSGSKEHWHADFPGSHLHEEVHSEGIGGLMSDDSNK